MEIHEFSDYLKLQNSFGPRTGAGMPTRLVFLLFSPTKRGDRGDYRVVKKTSWSSETHRSNGSMVHQKSRTLTKPGPKLKKKHMQPVTGHRHINELVHILDLWNMDL